MARRPLSTLVLSAAILVGAPVGVRAQDTSLTRLLVANRHPVILANGRLEAAGGRILVDASRSARFVLVGEEHGVAETPQVMQAMLRELRPAGFNTLAIEVSPYQGARLDSMAHHPGTPQALGELLASWYSTVAFYPVVEEHALLESAMMPEGTVPPMRIWGLDYEISADRLMLAELEGLAPASGRPAIRRARDLAEAGFLAVVRDKNPTRLFAWSAPDSVFTALRASFGRRMPPRAGAIVNVLERSARINRLFLSGDGYASNQMRSAYLRQNFAKAFAAAERRNEPPRVFFKFGGNHIMRGFNSTNTLDLGTAATVLAESRGERAYTVLILGGSGTRAARMNIMTLQYQATEAGEVDDASLAWLRPAVPDSGWVLFDLTRVRAAFLGDRRRVTLPAAQDRFLHGYDAIVVLTGSTPGTPGHLEVR